MRFMRKTAHRTSLFRLETTFISVWNLSDVRRQVQNSLGYPGLSISGMRLSKRNRLRTEETSKSTNSGAARRSWLKRRRAWSPSSPSSARTGSKTLASTTITVFAQRSYCLREGDRSPGSTASSLHDFFDGGSGGLLYEPLAQVLLEGLIGCGRPSAEYGVGCELLHQLSLGICVHLC